MPTYKNLGSDSGVHSYEIGTDFIKVTFNDGSEYLYNNAITGKHNVDKMKNLAEVGTGLNGFINTNVRKHYAAKLK